MRCKLLRVVTSSSRYGGNIYETYLSDALKHCCNVAVFHAVPSIAKYVGRFAVFGFLYRLFQLCRDRRYDVQMRALETAFFLGRSVRHIVVAHHYDPSYSPLLSRWMQRLAYANMKRNRQHIDTVVVVSRYWKDFFEEEGFRNVFLLYNPFDVARFHAEREAVNAFKKRYGMHRRKIVYIGNAQRKKGVIETYETLKDEEYLLVTSGKVEVELPVLNLSLSFEEYVLLLHAADVVVTMSLFKEGWNRTAHEAMLCKTPVVGSGAGGMRELLEGGKQLVCDNFSDLKEAVRYAIAHPELGEAGYAFASTFTLERFEREAQKMIEEVMPCAALSV